MGPHQLRLKGSGFFLDKKEGEAQDTQGKWTWSWHETRRDPEEPQLPVLSLPKPKGKTQALAFGWKKLRGQPLPIIRSPYQTRLEVQLTLPER